MDSGGEKRSVSFLLQIESYPGLTGFPPNESTRFTVHSVNFDGMRKSWGSWIEIRYGKEIDARGSVSKHRSIAISWVVNCIVDLWFFFPDNCLLFFLFWKMCRAMAWSRDFTFVLVEKLELCNFGDKLYFLFRRSAWFAWTSYFFFFYITN